MRARGVYATCISRHEVPRRDRFRLRFKINVASGAPQEPRARSGVGQGVLPFAARGRRSAPRPPHGTRPGAAVDLCGTVRGSRRPVPEHHRKYML